jgi:hydroxypyruvate reductase
MLRDDAIAIWKAGVAAVHGQTLVENALRIENESLFINNQPFDLNRFDKILVVGGGKFSHFMAQGLEAILGDELAKRFDLTGLITVPDDSNEQVRLKYIESAECRPTGINLPTQRVLVATDRMLESLSRTDAKTLTIALISGGGSALLESSKLPLADIVAATNCLSLNGANIIELNSVRIAMSDVKGGGLAKAMPAGTMASLIVSDVPNDDIRFVSSGPTLVFEEDPFESARQVVESFSANEQINFPQSVSNHFSTPYQSRSLRCDLHNFLIGSAIDAHEAAIQKAESLGYEVVADVLEGRNTCEQIASAAREWCEEPCCNKQAVISLGEPVITPGDGAGQGGRNQHCVLATAGRLVKQPSPQEFCFLSAGTDGEDGNTTVAGAFVSHTNIEALATRESEIKRSLKQFDSHPLLAANDMVFESGPTATNVADLRVLLRIPT